MIDSKELMIGNWVLAPQMGATVLTPGTPMQVKGIDIFGRITFNTNPHIDTPDVPIKHISPIPLTPEVLGKIEGMVHNEYRGTFTHGVFPNEIILSRYDDEQWKIWRGTRYIGIWSLPYLHTLQNFFSLTQTELKIEL